jgi:hypothetical protein
VAALHQQDIVDVGSRGRLVERQPLEPHVPWQVLVQHARSYRAQKRADEKEGKRGRNLRAKDINREERMRG